MELVKINFMAGMEMMNYMEEQVQINFMVVLELINYMGIPEMII